MRRLKTFSIKGATPASVPPGKNASGTDACFTFDPLFREMLLFVERSREPITRAAFYRAPWEIFGSDVAVRQFGILLAAEVEPQPDPSSNSSPFTFGDAVSGFRLHPTDGMRLPDVRFFRSPMKHFVITAEWRQKTGIPKVLGSLSTRHAALQDSASFQPGVATTAAGRLAITVQIGRAGLGWLGLPLSDTARFPGAVVAVRAARTVPLRNADGLYVYLPAAFLGPGDKLTSFVADDGSTYTDAGLTALSLARAAEGQVYPPRNPGSGSTEPAGGFTKLDRSSAGLRLADTSRFAGAAMLFQAELCTGPGVFQPIAAVATVDQAPADYPLLQISGSWPALQSVPSKRAVKGDLPDLGLLTVLIKPLPAGGPVPPTELIVRNRRGQSLLVYLPELDTPPAGIRVFVADDGSTYRAPDAGIDLVNASLAGLPQSRRAEGQVLPVPGIWPLQQRRPVALDLCRCERSSLLRPGELGIDPELGRFAFAPGDPAIMGGHSGISVDYVTAFSDRVGALNFDRALDPGAATRFVSKSGDAESPLTTDITGPPVVHDSVAAAILAAHDKDVIEIVDSATYAVQSEIALSHAAVKALTIRAAEGQRPCLTFYKAENTPTAAGFRVSTLMSRLEINGLLISGGPLRIESPVQAFYLTACTLDPGVNPLASLIVPALEPIDGARYLVCRSITAGLRLDPGSGQLTVADSIIDQKGGVAIAGLPAATSPPGSAQPEPAAGNVQLERVTVLGRIWCDVLVASECLLDDLARVEDRQAGCIRFSRFERGSVLPRRFQCVPSEEHLAACPPTRRCLAPRFNSRRFGRPDYVQLAAAGPPEILSASEARAEIGAFASALNPIRLSNLEIKLREFMPVGLLAVIVAET